jgi:hypothetical protein
MATLDGRWFSGCLHLNTSEYSMQSPPNRTTDLRQQPLPDAAIVDQGWWHVIGDGQHATDMLALGLRPDALQRTMRRRPQRCRAQLECDAPGFDLRQLVQLLDELRDRIEATAPGCRRNAPLTEDEFALLAKWPLKLV